MNTDPVTRIGLHGPSRAQRRLGRVMVVCACLSQFVGPALAQPVERDPLNLPARQSAVIAPPNLDVVVADETPIEGPLTSVLFLSETDAVLPPGEIAAGVDTQRVALIDDDAFRQTLADYLGKPVSLRLITEIEAETANWFRAKGMPFVSIFAPEQEITGGVLQFRVTEFRLGDKVAHGREADWLEGGR
jgi:hemolysin activation/secretion protein